MSILKKKSRSAPKNQRRLSIESLEDRTLLSTGLVGDLNYLTANLVSDLTGLASVTDNHLVNPWGIASSITGPFWISDNGAGLATVYNNAGTPFPAGSPLLVTIPPPPGSAAGTLSKPTGVIFNGSTDFAVSGTTSGSSTFIFATANGTIGGWNAGDGASAVLAVNKSATGAIYTGLALDANSQGNLLLAANFHAGTIDVFDKNFAPATVSGGFRDSSIPAGYAPFNIENINGKIYVTYALQNAAKTAPVFGSGDGFVDVFDSNGNLLNRLIAGGTASSPLNAPWGIALAPSGFGRFSNDLLIGNTGDGHINAFDATTGALVGVLTGDTGSPITIPGLHGLQFGNGGSAGATNSLFFTAGSDNGLHGLFGSLQNQVASIVGLVNGTGQLWQSLSNGLNGLTTSLLTALNPALKWVDVISADFTGTGGASIAARDSVTGNWWVVVANGSTIATSIWTSWNPLSAWTNVQVGDFNGDGKMDIIALDKTTGNWQVALSNGSSFINSTWVTWSTGTSQIPVTWVDVKIGDLNGDGKADIIGRWLQGGQWWASLSTGSGFATSLWNIWNTAATWVDVNVGDFNGDGKADITGRWLQGGQWWTGISTGSSLDTHLWTTWNTLATWVDVKVGDFNGDGKADITGLWKEGGQLWTALSNGTSFVNSLWGTLPANVSWVDAQVGDFNGDGKDDLAVRGLQTGDWMVSLSTGSTFNSSVWATWSTGVNWTAVQANAFAGANAGVTTPSTTNSTSLITLDLPPIDLNLLGLQVETNAIQVTISAQPGQGELLGNLLTTVANLVNLKGVNQALNTVLASVVNLLDSTSLSISGVNTTSGPLANAAVATTPVLDAFVAPVHLNLLGALVDTSPIHLTITAQSGPGLVLGNVIADLANLFNPPLPSTLNIDTINNLLTNLLNELNTQIPLIGSSPTTTPTTPLGQEQVLALTVPPINVDLLGLILKTSQIQVNANAQTGNGELLGNVLTTLLNTLGATPQNLSTLNANLNALLAKVVGVLNASSLILSPTVLDTLTGVLQTLSLPNLINTTGTSATTPILNLIVASTDGTTPPVDVNLLGLVVTTSNIQAQLLAQTGDGQVLGNLLYNVANLLNPGGSLSLLSILNALAL